MKRKTTRQESAKNHDLTVDPAKSTKGKKLSMPVDKAAHLSGPKRADGHLRSIVATKCAGEIVSLSTDKRKTFKRLDAIVAKGMATFVDVGRALTQIQSHRLYRECYESFEDYFQRRHDLSKSQAYRLIESAATVANLKKSVPHGGRNPPKLPSSERQCRELSSVPDGAKPEVWQRVCDRSTTTGQPITGKLVREIAEPYRQPKNGAAEAEFDPDTRGDRLLDWLRKELDTWPEEFLPQALDRVQLVHDEF